MDEETKIQNLKVFQPELPRNPPAGNL
jgi:hypothetical protein